MITERPVNLNLLRLRFPVMAVVSILHRITGVMIFLFLPALLYILHASLSSPKSYSSLVLFLERPWSRVFLLMIIASTVYHLFAGIRHLIMDCGVWEGKTTGRITAWLAILITIVSVVLLGVYLW